MQFLFPIVTLLLYPNILETNGLLVLRNKSGIRELSRLELAHQSATRSQDLYIACTDTCSVLLLPLSTTPSLVSSLTWEWFFTISSLYCAYYTALSVELAGLSLERLETSLSQERQIPSCISHYLLLTAYRIRRRAAGRFLWADSRHRMSAGGPLLTIV